MGKTEDAKAIFDKLIEWNNSCKKYYLGYLGRVPEDSEESGLSVKVDL